MKIRRPFPDLLTPLGTAASVEAGLARTLRRLVALTGASAGALAFRPPRRAPIVVTHRSHRRAPSGAALRDLVAVAMPRGARVTGRGRDVVMSMPLGAPAHPVGALALVGAPRAFDPVDAKALAELAGPLAAALERRRLLDEARRRAAELAALCRTSRLLTASGDLVSVLDRISRSVAALIGSGACSIGLLDDTRRCIRHIAAYGFKSEEWRALALPVGEGIVGRCAQTGRAIRMVDVRRDRRSAQRDVDEREGIRSMLCVPVAVGGIVLGVLSAFARRPAAFSADQQRVLEAFAEQAGIAIHNVRLVEQREHRARETRALLEAGRAVTASLDPERTIRLVLEQAQAVLNVDSCSLMTLDPVAKELSTVASLDLPPEIATRVRLREGQGIGGLAFAQRKPVQSPDLFIDPRAHDPELARATGLRSILAAPLRIGERAIGVITVLRRDVHHFTADEEELLLALADQAAIALDHARLYGELEAMVTERTLELERQKRFVEVVLETLPLGVFVVDADLALVRVNREGARLLGAAADSQPLPALLPREAAGAVDAFLRAALARHAVGVEEHEIARDGETRTMRWSVAPLETAGGAPHLVVLVEDVTRAKHLERQMLLTERLTTAGRLAAGVAHELNNPLATIAGCAESLQERLKDSGLAADSGLAEFPRYLALIEEEAFRCKEITGSLLQFVREPGSRRAPTDLNALVDKTLALLSHQSRFAGAKFTTDLDPALPAVSVNEGQLRQVFLAIASNGLEAMDGHGQLTIRTRQGRGDEAIVEFEDAGPGIPPAVVARIFDPFFTTKPPGHGTGLGLAIAQGIVADHGGRIEVRSAPERGAVFRVVLST